MKFENTRIFNFEGAFRGMRNPLESWDKSDSDFSDTCRDPDFIGSCENCRYFAGFGNECAPMIGENDLKLAQRLIRAGSEHRKFLRQIVVSVDITAPLYWWKEFDTYKVGTTANSTSTMHRLTSSPITVGCFEIDDYDPSLIYDDGDYPWNVSISVGDMIGSDTEDGCYFLDSYLDFLEKLRLKFVKTGDKKYWKELIRWLPESWLQKRTVTMNYENLFSIVRQRKNHKLNEWSGKDNSALPNFIAWAKTLPYAEEFLFLDEEERNG